MRKSMDIDFERCTSGIEFEEWVKELLGQLRMKAERVVKNDCGIPKHTNEVSATSRSAS